jgi:hypothetical protein
MESPTTPKTQTEALCLDIEQLKHKLGAKTIAFDCAKQLWRSVKAAAKINKLQFALCESRTDGSQFLALSTLAVSVPSEVIKLT